MAGPADSVARMRRSLPLAVLACALVVLAACGSSPSGNGGTAAPDTTSNVPKPSVSLPSSAPTSLVITDRTVGTGKKAAAGDKVVVNYIGVRDADGSSFDNSYDRGKPFEVTLGAGQVIPGWDQGLLGVQAGGQRQLDIPPALAYGDKGAGTKIKPGDALSFVIDVLAILSASQASDQPTVTVVKAGPTTTVKSTDLVVGSGASPAVGKKFAVQIILYRADTAELVTSTWGGPPVTFDFGPGVQTFPGVLAVADGMRVGGRRQAQLPFRQIFDGKGNTNLKVPAGIDLVIVMDLVAVY